MSVSALCEFHAIEYYCRIPKTEEINKAFANEFDFLKSFSKSTKNSTFVISSLHSRWNHCLWIAIYMLFVHTKNNRFQKKKKTWVLTDNKSICIHLNCENGKYNKSVKNGRKIGNWICVNNFSKIREQIVSNEFLIGSFESVIICSTHGNNSLTTIEWNR